MNHNRCLAAIFVEAISLGHVAKALAFVPILREGGYRVAVCMPKRHFRWARDVEAELHELRVKDSGDVYARLREAGPPYTAAEVSGYLAEDERVMRELEPALVVSEFRVTALAIARRLGIPTVALLEATTGPGFDLTTLSTPDTYLPAPWLPPGIVDAFVSTPVGKAYVRSQMRSNVAPWRAAYREYGLPVGANFFELVGDADVGLVTDLPGLIDYEPRPREHFTGPMPFAFPGAERFAVAHDANLPRVYVSLGTQASVEAGVIEQACRTLLDDGWAVYLSGGNRAVTWSLRHPRLSFLPFVDEDSVLAEVDLIIHPGGISTAYRAISHAVPQLLLPAHANQHWLADSLTRRGVGRFLRARRRRPTDWRETARHLLHDPRVRLATLDWQRRLRQTDARALSLPHVRRLAAAARRG